MFEAVLDADPSVKRTVALAGGATLDDLHEVLRDEFNWEDPHLYSFWLDGEYWGDREAEYTAPSELEEGATSPAVALDSLGLEAGQRLAYVFDLGDEWRVAITVREIADRSEEPLPAVLERAGVAPPQYELEE